MIKKEKVEPDMCPVTYCIDKIGGKWKPILLYLIRNGVVRFGVMQKGIKGISKQMLTTQLRELEKDGIISRVIFPEIPPRVEYSLTQLGETLIPIIDSMRDWGLGQMKKES